MGLKSKTLNLDDPLKFGRCKGSTIREVIDDSDCSLIQYYMNENIILLSNNAFKYLRQSCTTICEQCKDIL